MMTVNKMAQRLTNDGFYVFLWDDGVIQIPNLASRKIGIDAGWMLMDEVCVYDLSEFTKACRVMKAAWKQTKVRPLSYFRHYMSK